MRYTGHNRTTACFNSVLDFLVVATALSTDKFVYQAVFQFRLGFSGRRNGRGRLSTSRDGFQFRLGFSGRRNSISSSSSSSSRSVSIPSWIFWSSQLDQIGSTDDVDIGFNSVLDFLVVATRRALVGVARRRAVSIPFWVFWSSQRRSVTSTSSPTASFNSVLDFLVVATSQRVSDDHARGDVSIPSWIFWSSQRAISGRQSRPTGGFNSVLDFLVVATHVPMIGFCLQ